jgi:uncharacterized membrane protein YphA (DoxX/SURF4 family)
VMSAPSNSSSFNWRHVLGRSLAVLVGAVFVYAGILKVRDPLTFATDISNYQMIPWSVGIRMAFYLPWLEVLCGCALIFHRLYAGAVAITILLMFVFIGATAWARMQGIDISCGCFGSAGTNLSLTWHLILDGGLLLALFYVWFTRERVA